MAILIWKCKGCPVIVAAKLLGFKVGTYLLNCVLRQLHPTISPKQSYFGGYHNQETQVSYWNLLSQERVCKGMLNHEHRDTCVTNPGSITEYLQKSLPAAKRKAALLSRPGHKHSAGAGVRLKAAPISTL